MNSSSLKLECQLTVREKLSVYFWEDLLEKKFLSLNHVQLHCSVDNVLL